MEKAKRLREVVMLRMKVNMNPFIKAAQGIQNAINEMSRAVVVHLEKAESFSQKMEGFVEKAGPDYEQFHAWADDLMCEVLTELGYGEGVEIFKSQKVVCA